jgi:hypothetical protein
MSIWKIWYCEKCRNYGLTTAEKTFHCFYCGRSTTAKKAKKNNCIKLITTSVTLAVTEHQRMRERVKDLPDLSREEIELRVRERR